MKYELKIKKMEEEADGKASAQAAKEDPRAKQDLSG